MPESKVRYVVVELNANGDVFQVFGPFESAGIAANFGGLMRSIYPHYFYSRAITPVDSAMLDRAMGE